MSAPDNEELIDYEDEQDVPSGTAASATNGAGAAGAEGDGEGRNFSGIHSTGFRYVVCYRHRESR